MDKTTMNKEKIFENYITTQYSNLGHIDRDTIRKNLIQSVPELNNFGASHAVLDLGCGMGRFTHTCDYLTIKDYTGVDLSPEEIALCKKDFNHLGFKFYCENIFTFLNRTKRKYDLIFMSQVFEHLELDAGAELLKLVQSKLTDGGAFLNVMPNANGYYNSISNRYSDITHEIIYNQTSFSQLLKVLGMTNFEHRNFYIGETKFQHFVHRSYLKMFEFHLKLLGYDRWSIYTHSMITIIKKNGEKKNEK